VLESALQLLAWAALSGEKERPFIVSAVDCAVWRPSDNPPESVGANWRQINEDTVVGDAWLLDAAGAPILTLTGVHLERLAQTTVPQPADLLYEIVWQPVPLPPETAAAPGRWLILADSQGVGGALADQLRAEGHEVILVAAGERPEAYEAGLTAVLAGPCQAIVYLRGLDAPPSDPPDLAQVVEPALLLAQRVKQLSPDGAYPLWLVTQGAQPLSDAPLNAAQAPAQAALWGLGVVLAEEHHELWGGLVDLDPASPPEENGAQLKQQILHGRPEDRVAFHAGQPYAPRLAPHKLRLSPPDSPWRADAAYLITGGLGEIALELAPWAVSQGARRLLLLGRSPLPPRADWPQLAPDSPAGRRTRAIRALEALGASVHYAAVDVSDKDQLYDFLDNYAAEGWPPIRGIIHAAAVLEDKLLPELDAASLRRVLGAKAQAAWLLHRYFDERRP
jgi:NAD(P)-dependent dehydrogenase (short-subunit alcohol dehydrogenase family)